MTDSGRAPALFPGTRVLVFDSRLYIDDRCTPLSHTMRPATVVQWYGITAAGSRFGPYENMIDVEFDYRPGISRGHFGDYIHVLAPGGSQ